jgi:hypothetical protein
MNPTLDRDSASQNIADPCRTRSATLQPTLVLSQYLRTILHNALNEQAWSRNLLSGTETIN